MKSIKYLPVLDWFFYRLKMIVGIGSIINLEKIFIPLSVHRFLKKKRFKQLSIKNGKAFIWEKMGLTVDINGNYDLDFSLYSNGCLLVAFVKNDSAVLYCVVFDMDIEKDCIGGFIIYKIKVEEIIKEVSDLVIKKKPRQSFD